MINSEQFLQLANEMIKNYFSQKELDATDLKLSLIDTSTIINVKKGLFVTNKSQELLFEIVVDLTNKKSYLTAFKVDGNQTFDININEPQKQEEQSQEEK